MQCRHSIILVISTLTVVFIFASHFSNTMSAAVLINLNIYC